MMRKFKQTIIAMLLLTLGYVFAVWTKADASLFQTFALTLGGYLGVFTYGNVQEHRSSKPKEETK